MKKLIIVAILAAFTINARAQMDEKEQKIMMEYGKLGKMHNMLAKYEGNWTENIKMWMGPKTDPVNYEAKVKTEMTMGGRYQVSTHTGEMMGMRFTGMSTTAYDNARDMFVNTWIDNFGTGIMTSEGKMNQETGSIEFKGMCTDPLKKKLVPFRQVLYIIDGNTQRMEMYMPDKDGMEYKSMEILMRRA